MKEELTTNTLQDFVDAYKAADYRAGQRLIEKSEVSGQLRNMLMGKNEERFAKNVRFQEEQLEVMEKAIQQERDKIQQCRNERAKACEKLKEAQKAFRAAQAEVDKQEQRLRETERNVGEMEKRLHKEEKRLEQMKRFTLVHPTATLTSIDKRKETVIVCTKFDMSLKGFADLIFVSDDDFAENDIPKDARERFGTIQEYISAIEYVKMVIHYWAEDKPYEALYNSEGIKYILDSIL